MAVGFSAVTYALCKRATSAEIKKAIEGLSEGMKFKGSVATVEDLPDQHDTGDLYLVRDEGAKAVWDGEQWVIFDHALKVKDGSLTISDNKIGVNISTEVGNNLQLKEDGLYVPVEGTIGITFVTDITVGHLKAGTHINATDKVSEILYRILYSQSGDTIKFYYGSLDRLPTSVEGLTEVTKNVDELLLRSLVQNVASGNEETLEGQYVVFALQKGANIRNISLKKLITRGYPDTEDSAGLSFLTIEGEDNVIYYIGSVNEGPTKVYDVDLDGTDYILTFEEEV